MSKQTFVIVGASLAGAKAAEALREEGFDGRIVLLGEELERPYERPPLSKDYLRGESEREKAYIHTPAFYSDQEIELEPGTTVAAIDLGASRVTMAGGRELAFDRLLLSTGARPRRLAVEGAELGGVYYLRTLADCDALRERLESGAHVVVIGAGWIGSEVAASSRQKGLEVTMLDPQALPNERIFGSEVGTFYRDVHAQHGVELLLGDGVEALIGHGSVERVRTVTGREIECDFVVVGVGIEPRVELALAAGLEVDGGVVLDEHLRASAPNVFAAGDVARAWHPFFGERVRLEHWANALNQGPAAGRAMLGATEPYDRIPYFFSDQYDVGMEYSGYAPKWDEVLIRPGGEENAFVAFWLRDGLVVAGMNVNVWDVNEQIQALIRARTPIASELLLDPDTPLDTVAAGA